MALSEEGIVVVPDLYSRWIRLTNGTKAHYMTAGETGPAVVLIHGGLAGSSASNSWHEMAPFLGTNGFRVYCPDIPGFGLTTEWERYHPGYLGQLNFLEDFVDALCLDRFFIGGTSMGAMTTMNYITAHPHRIKSYATLSSTSFGGDLTTPEERAAVDTRTEKFDLNQFDGTVDSMRRMMDAFHYQKHPISDDWLTMWTNTANNNVEHTRTRAAYTKNPDPNIERAMSVKGRFDKLTVPGIYVFGRQDVTASLSVGELQESRLLNVQFFYPDQCGHHGQFDQRDLVHQVFLEFFRDGKVSRKTADSAGVSKNRPENPVVVAAT